jgi:hypothetical protein
MQMFVFMSAADGSRFAHTPLEAGENLPGADSGWRRTGATYRLPPLAPEAALGPDSPHRQILAQGYFIDTP